MPTAAANSCCHVKFKLLWCLHNNDNGLLQAATQLISACRIQITHGWTQLEDFAMYTIVMTAYTLHNVSSGFCAACRTATVPDMQSSIQPADHLIPAGGNGTPAPTPANPEGAPSMLAYINPAFNPAFVSRIPKPAPLQPPLQELSSTSHMQPAQQQQQLASTYVFSQPGHGITSFVSNDDGPEAEPAGPDPLSGMHAEHAVHGAAEQHSNDIGGAEADTDFGGICQRLVAMIEVGPPLLIPFC